MHRIVSKPVFTLKGDLAPTLSCDYLVVGPEHAGYAVELTLWSIRPLELALHFSQGTTVLQCFACSE